MAAFKKGLPVPAAAPTPTPTRLSANSSIILITGKPGKAADRVILVRDTVKKKWMIPGGSREPSESDYECALREFREETGWDIDPEFITARVISYIYMAGDPKQTKIYIIQSTQQFPKYDSTKVHKFSAGPNAGRPETDELHYLKLDDLRRLVINKKPHTTVNILRSSSMLSLNELFIRGIL